MSGQWPHPSSSAPGMSTPVQSGVPGWCSLQYLPAEGASWCYSGVQGLIVPPFPSLLCGAAGAKMLLSCCQPCPVGNLSSPSSTPLWRTSSNSWSVLSYGSLLRKSQEEGLLPTVHLARAVLCSASLPWHPSLRGQVCPDLFSDLGCSQHLAHAFYSLSPCFPAGSPADLDTAMPRLD